jgi:hypothetical protein
VSPFLGTRGAGTNKAFGFAGAAAPNQVTGLSATDFGTSRAYNNGRIDLSWSTPANNGATISGYKIERSTDNSTYSTLVANTGSATTTYSDTGLSSNQIYYYKVSAINAAGTGLASTAANATSTTVPQAPTIGTPTRTNNTTVSLAFTAGATGGKTITSFTAVSSPSISLTTTGTSTPLTVTGTYATNQAYTFTLTATNANGTSTASSASSSVTPYPAPIVTGGTLTSDATYYYRTFNSSGTLGVNSAALNADYLVVAGGGGAAAGSSNAAGWAGAGGGGITFLTGQTFNIGNYTATVGAGGSNDSSGSTSTLGNTNASGGGQGGTFGGSVNARRGGTSGNGVLGGYGNNRGGAGGGGAGNEGSVANTDGGFPGGNGLSYFNSTYGGGGGGGSGTDGYPTGGSGGSGGGGQGANFESSSMGYGSSGAANTGGGAGGLSAVSGYNNFRNTPPTGGSGVVVVRYTRSQVGG